MNQKSILNRTNAPVPEIRPHGYGFFSDFPGRKDGGCGIYARLGKRYLSDAGIFDEKTIRLDVLEGNIPAEKAYVKMGFVYLDTVQMFYEDTGWTNYKAFEFIV